MAKLSNLFDWFTSLNHDQQGSVVTILLFCIGIPLAIWWFGPLAVLLAIGKFYAGLFGLVLCTVPVWLLVLFATGGR